MNDALIIFSLKILLTNWQCFYILQNGMFNEEKYRIGLDSWYILMTYHWSKGNIWLIDGNRKKKRKSEAYMHTQSHQSSSSKHVRNSQWQTRENLQSLSSEHVEQTKRASLFFLWALWNFPSVTIGGIILSERWRGSFW